MRNNKKRGFTLVELLVVIAILAILATVSVVGYTSFIKSAHISNDENIAAQLNQFLAAYQADHTTEHYGKPITEDNIWEITQTILKDSQLGDLEPHAKDYGYHYYFKFDGQGGGEYVARDENGLTASMLMRLWNTVVGAESSKAKAGLFVENGVEYFLVDTKGSTIAEAIRGFYSFGKIEGTTSAQQFAAFVEIIDKLEEEGEYPEVVALAKTSVFATKEGNYAFDATNTHAYLYVHDDATFVDNKIYSVDDEGNLSGSKYLDATTPLLTITKDTKIVIPAGVSLPAYSLHVTANGGIATIVINANGWDSLKTIVDANFTNATTVIKVNNSEYKLTDATDGNGITYPCKDVYAGDKYVVTLGDNFALTDFTLTLQGIENKVLNHGASSSVALDNLTFTPMLTNINKISNKPASNTSNDSVVWSISSIKINLDTTAITDKDTINKYVSIDESTGTITFVKEDGKVLPTVDEVVIEAESRKDSSVNNSLILNVWRIIGSEYTLNKKQNPISVYLTYQKDKTTENEFKVVLNKNTYNNGESLPVGLVLDDAITLEYGNLKGLSDEISDEGIRTIITNSEATGETGSLRVNIGEYKDYDSTLVVNDGEDFPVKAKNNGNLTTLGNGSAINIYDLFSGTIPANAEIRIGIGYEDDTFMEWNRTIVKPTADAAEGELNVEYPTSTADLDLPYIPVGTDINFNNTSFTKVDSTTGKDIYETIYISVFHDGVRISEDVKVKIVNAVNVKSYSDLIDKIKNNNVVLLGEIDMDSEGSMTISEKHLYGNGYKFDITLGKYAGVNGIITLNSAHLHDLKVIGQTYEDVAMSGMDDGGSNAVLAKGSSSITNCYLANTRAPLSIGYEGDNTGYVIVEDSVIFGGRFANIEIRNGVLKTKGTVITINQPHDAPEDELGDIAGAGIVVWLEATNSYTPEGATDPVLVTYIDNSECNLIQYNFIPYSAASDKNVMPTLSMTIPESAPIIGSLLGGQTIEIPLGDMFEDIFCHKKDCIKSHVCGKSGEGSCCNRTVAHAVLHIVGSCKYTGSDDLKYAGFIFESNGEKYVNPSILSLNQSAPNVINNTTVGYVYDTTTYKYLMDLYIYSLKDGVEVNEDLLEASMNAVDKYSYWNTDEYKAYDFKDGKILPEELQ